MSTPPLFEFKQIYKTYEMGDNTVQALKGIDLSVSQGELVAIVGKSGSGKSTMMNIIGLLDRPTTGHYFLSGRDVNQLQDDELAHLRNKKIGFVFQSFHLGVQGKHFVFG